MYFCSVIYPVIQRLAFVTFYKRKDAATATSNATGLSVSTTSAAAQDAPDVLSLPPCAQLPRTYPDFADKPEPAQAENEVPDKGFWSYVDRQLLKLYHETEMNTWTSEVYSQEIEQYAQFNVINLLAELSFTNSTHSVCSMIWPRTSHRGEFPSMMAILLVFNKLLKLSFRCIKSLVGGPSFYILQHI
jgi:hypothetical protein